jgi:LemA protein
VWVVVDMDPITIAGIVLLVLVLLWYVMTYNRLIKMKVEVDRAWSNIDVLLQQRYEMIPNLVNMVKGYAAHENDLFMEFAKARQSAAGALANGDVKGIGAAEGTLAGLMPKLNFVAEQYPDLKADTQFLNLQKELVSIENQVSDRREYYNSSVGNWNSAIQMIPSNVVASTMGAKEKDMFNVTVEEVRQGVKVEF